MADAVGQIQDVGAGCQGVGDIKMVEVVEATLSSQNALNVNQASVLTGVSVLYMSSNGSSFADGDEVLVKFTGQSFAASVVIGFKHNPKADGAASGPVVTYHLDQPRFFLNGYLDWTTHPWVYSGGVELFGLTAKMAGGGSPTSWLNYADGLVTIDLEDPANQAILEPYKLHGWYAYYFTVIKGY